MPISHNLSIYNNQYPSLQISEDPNIVEGIEAGMTSTDTQIKLLNVARADIPAVATGIAAVQDGASGSRIEATVSGGDICVSFPQAYEPYSITVCDLAGRVLRSVTGSGTAGEVTVSCPAAAGGCVVVRATQGRNAVTRKLVIG